MQGLGLEQAAAIIDRIIEKGSKIRDPSRYAIAAVRDLIMTEDAPSMDHEYEDHYGYHQETEDHEDDGFGDYHGSYHHDTEIPEADAKEDNYDELNEGIWAGGQDQDAIDEVDHEWGGQNQNPYCQDAVEDDEQEGYEHDYGGTEERDHCDHDQEDYWDDDDAAWWDDDY